MVEIVTLQGNLSVSVCLKQNMYLKSVDLLLPSNVDAQTSYIAVCCIDIGQLFPLEHD